MSEIGQEDWKGREGWSNLKHQSHRVLNHVKIGSWTLNLGQENNKDLKNWLVLLEPLTPRLYLGRLGKEEYWIKSRRQETVGFRNTGARAKENDRSRNTQELGIENGKQSPLKNAHVLLQSQQLLLQENIYTTRSCPKKSMKTSRERTATEGYYLKKYFSFLLPHYPPYLIIPVILWKSRRAGGISGPDHVPPFCVLLLLERVEHRRDFRSLEIQTWLVMIERGSLN